MSKLPEKHQFLDLSDYGRSLGQFIATASTYLPNANSCNYNVYNFRIYSYWIILKGYLITSAFLMLKSILDAADGDLARLKKPSYIGRYYDSIQI